MNKLLLWEILCLALVWSVFCRSTLVDINTRFDVKMALRLLGLAAIAGMAFPLYGYMPTWEAIALAAIAVCVQALTARNWRNGVPRRFTRRLHRDHRSES